MAMPFNTLCDVLLAQHGFASITEQPALEFGHCIWSLRQGTQQMNDSVSTPG